VTIRQHEAFKVNEVINGVTNGAIKGDGKLLHEKDTICVNSESEYVTDWVSENNVCSVWEEAR